MDSKAERCELITIIKLANAMQVHPFVLLGLIFRQLGANGQPLTALVHSQDAAEFIPDAACPKNRTIPQNQRFSEKWEIINTGAIAWKNRHLVCIDETVNFSRRRSDFASGNARNGLTPEEGSIPVPEILPGSAATLEINFTSPGYPGLHVSRWKMVDCSGNFCFPEAEEIVCAVKVAES